MWDPSQVQIVPRAVVETPEWSLGGESRRRKLILPDSIRCSEAVTPDELG